MLAIGGYLALSPCDSVLNLCEFPQDGLAVHGQEPACQSLVPTAGLAAPLLAVLSRTLAGLILGFIADHEFLGLGG